MFKKYFYIIKNSFLEFNQHPAFVVISLLESSVQIYGLILFYSYLVKSPSDRLTLSTETVVYFLFILVVSSVDIKRFASDIKREIINEEYLNINKLPINPFLYYFLRSIGKNSIVFLILLIGSLIYMVHIGYPLSGLLLFLPAIMISFLLLHFIFFTTVTINFVNEYFNIWLFGIIFDFLSGKLIPLMFLPALMETILLRCLPFTYAFGALAKIFSNYDLKNLLISMAVSIVWCIVLFFVSKKLWNKGGYYFQEK